MKKILLFLFSLLSISLVLAQTGPGGVGNASNIDAWMDASRLSLINNDPVSSWTDFSGNANNATQALSSRQPVFLTNQLNGLPAIDFDGVNDHLDFLTNISVAATTIFTVSKNDATTVRATFSTQNHSIFTEFASATAIYFSPTTRYKVSKTNFQYSVFSLQTGASATSGSIFLTNESSSNTFTRVNFANRPTSAIGTRYSGATPGLFNDGQIAEIIVFNEEINSAKRKIVSNHLAAKYNLTPEQNLYSFANTHGNQVIGLGQEADGSHTIARGLDSLEIQNPSSLGNGDYILVGNDEGGYATSSSVPADAIQRWEQVWRADITGTPGSIDLTFFLGSNDFATDPNDYVVLIENIDGDFSNGGTSQQETGRVYDAVNNTVSFTGISLIDGAFFTLAEKDAAAPPPPPATFIDFGPGGVGNTDNIAVWMDASRLSFSNNDPVDSWLDVSGNDNHAEQSISLNQPQFLTNQLNGLPAIDFDGVNDHLDFLTNISVAATTIFTVSKNDATTTKATFSTQNHSIFTEFASATAIYFSPTTRYKVSKTNFQFSVFSMQTEANTTSGSIFLTNENYSNTFTRVNFANRPTSAIGTRYSGATPGLFNDGQIAEIIVFNEEINSAKRKIVSNHLAAKYNLTAEQSLYAFGSTHGTQVIGIGQEADGSHLEARGRDSLLINNASALGNGDYILIGNDNADFSVSTAVPSGVQERWNRTWRADLTGTPGTIDVEFFLGSNSFATTSDYVVLIEEADGDFTNGGTRIHEIGRSFNAGNLSISFTDLDLADGATFTLAEKSGPITSITDGDWNNVNTWDCSCIPGELSLVDIEHDVTINQNESVLDISLNNGSILFSSSDSLFIFGNFNNEVTNAPFMAGTIVIANTIDLQTFSGTGTASIEMDNLYVNAAGLTVESGEWAILNNIQVASGTITGDPASNMVFASSVSKTSQILPSVSNAFSGEFLVERFLSARNANFANLASPISDATVADLDDDLILSGVGGINGNSVIGSNIFRSMSFFDSPTDTRQAITSTSTALPSARGYEVYLADTIGIFNGSLLNYRGTPFSGTTTVTADQGWNLIGNPYHSFIDYSTVSKGSMSNNYYIFNSTTGTYSLFTGGGLDPIAPGQGFWAEKLTSGNQLITFDENDKADNHSASFIRSKKTPKFKLELSNLENKFSHHLELNFDIAATNGIDELDASYLPSPIMEAPAIYSKAVNSDKGLILNSLNPFEESQLIPVEIYAGVKGTYSIRAESVNELYNNYSCIYLKDKVNSQVIDLTVESNYQFETTEGTSNRFELIMSNSFAECEKMIDDGSYTQQLDHNLDLRNAYGQWFVDYTLDDNQQQVEVRILNMNGQEVREPISFGASNAGTYALPNLQDLNGIYLIQVKTKDGFINKTVKL